MVLFKKLSEEEYLQHLKTILTETELMERKNRLSTNNTKKVVDKNEDSIDKAVISSILVKFLDTLDIDDKIKRSCLSSGYTIIMKREKSKKEVVSSEIPSEISNENTENEEAADINKVVWELYGRKVF